MIMVSKEEWDNMMEKGFEAMVQALNTFGPSETLSMLLRFSNGDPVMNHLLTKYPSVVAIGDFFGRLLVYENRGDKVKEKIKVKKKSNGKCIGKKEGPRAPKDTSRIFDESPDPLFDKILDSELRTS
jgi:hypothetical protein